MTYWYCTYGLNNLRNKYILNILLFNCTFAENYEIISNEESFLKIFWGDTFGQSVMKSSVKTFGLYWIWSRLHHLIMLKNNSLKILKLSMIWEQQMSAITFTHPFEVEHYTFTLSISYQYKLVPFSYASLVLNTN